MYEELLEYDKKSRALLGMQLRISGTQSARRVDALMNELQNLSNRKNNLEAELAKLSEQFEAVIEAAQASTKSIDACQTELEKLKEEFASGAISEKAYSARFESIRKKLEALNRPLYDASKTATEIAAKAKECEDGIQALLKKGKETVEVLKPLKKSFDDDRKAALAPLKAEKEAAGKALEAVDASLRTAYDRIAKSHTDPLAEIADGCCSGCNMRLPAQILAQVDNAQIVNCGNCGRIIIKR